MSLIDQSKWLVWKMPRGFRDWKKRPRVDFFFPSTLGGLTNYICNQAHVQIWQYYVIFSFISHPWTVTLGFCNLGSRCVETSERSDGPRSLKSEAKKVNKTQLQDVSTTSGAIWWVGVGSCDISHNHNNYITMIISRVAYTHNCHGRGFQQQHLSGRKWTL